MGVFVNDQDNLREITRIFVNDQGTLREITSIHVNDQGTLRSIYLISVELQDVEKQQFSNSPTDARTGWQIKSNGEVADGVGTVSVSYGERYTWLLQGAASDYEVRFTLTSGNTPTGTLNTWMACSTTRAVELAATFNGNQHLTSTLLVEVRRVVGGTVVGSCTVILDSEVSI